MLLVDPSIRSVEATNRTSATKLALFAAGFVMGLGMLLLGTPQAAHATPMFTECPAIGSDTGCEFLITLSGGTGTITKDSTQPAFGGDDDVLVGVLNNTGHTVSSIFINGGSLDIFDFDGNGLCTAGAPNGHPAGCPFGPTGYEGQTNTGNDTSFSGRNSAHTSGFVNFTGGLANGGTAYFNLEDDPTGSRVSTVPEPSTIFLFGSALLGLPALRRLLA